MIDEQNPNDRERLITAKRAELLTVVEAHKALRTDVAQCIAFDYGKDAIMQEAVLRLIQEDIGNQLEADGTLDKHDLSQVMAEVREQMESFINREE